MHKKTGMFFGKRIFTLLVCILLFTAVFPLLPSADQSIENPETGYQIILSDKADLLSKTEEELLLQDMEEISAFGNVGFVSVYDHPWTSEFDFADAWYHEQFGKESGVILIIDMKLRKITVFSDGQIYRTVTKSYANTITDNIYTYASDGDYYLCAQKGFQQSLSLLQGRRIAQPMKYISNLLLALITALLLNYLRAALVSGSSNASDREWLEKLRVSFAFTNIRVRHTGTTKTYNPPSSSGGSGGSGGGGGSSGGGGSHSF